MQPSLPVTVTVKNIEGATHCGAFTMPDTDTDTETDKEWVAVADPGFSPGGAPTPKVGVLIYYCCRKLHENERIWTPGGGGARPWRPPLWIRQWVVQNCVEVFILHRDRHHHKFPLDTVVIVSVLVSVSVSVSGRVNTPLMLR